MWANPHTHIRLWKSLVAVFFFTPASMGFDPAGPVTAIHKGWGFWFSCSRNSYPRRMGVLIELYPLNSYHPHKDGVLIRSCYPPQLILQRMGFWSSCTRNSFLIFQSIRMAIIAYGLHDLDVLRLRISLYKSLVIIMEPRKFHPLLGLPISHGSS